MCKLMMKSCCAGLVPFTRIFQGAARNRLVRRRAILVAILALFGATASLPAAPQFQVLHTFAGFPDDGTRPVAGVVQAVNGDLYGTADSGVYRLNPNGTNYTWVGPAQ